MANPTFDQDYYARFYQDEATRAVSPEEQSIQVAFIAAYLRYLQIPVTSVLDVGCGLGQMLAAVQLEFPQAECSGLELSTHLCEHYGWEHASVVDYAGPGADLVMCNDVLGYLSKKDCIRAIDNLARLSHPVLYLSVATAEDDDTYDPEHTDMQQTFRPEQFYRKHLARHFTGVGGGLFIKNPVPVPIWQLEKAQ